jgi:hypothetical protein
LTTWASQEFSPVATDQVPAVSPELNLAGSGARSREGRAPIRFYYSWIRPRVAAVLPSYWLFTTTALFGSPVFDEFSNRLAIGTLLFSDFIPVTNALILLVVDGIVFRKLGAQASDKSSLGQSSNAPLWKNMQQNACFCVLG